MLKQLRWLLLLVCTGAYTVNGPIIYPDTFNFQKIDDVYYMLPNATPKFRCEVEAFGATVWPLDVFWFLNGENKNASKIGGEKSTGYSKVKVYHLYRAADNFGPRDELKCVLNATRKWPGSIQGSYNETTVFLEVAKPVSEVKAFFSPNDTTKLAAHVGGQFDAYCTGNSLLEMSFLWQAKYPGTTSWNQVGYSSNLTEHVIKELHPGPTFYRCQATNMANDGNNTIYSQELELDYIEPELTVKPTWSVTVNLSQEIISVDSAVDHNLVDSTIMAVVWGVSIALVICVGIFAIILLYIKYRRKTLLEHAGSDSKESKLTRSMKPYCSPPSHPMVNTKKSGASDADSAYASIAEIPAYEEIETMDTSKTVKGRSSNYLTPKSKKKFLPLPNIPGRIPTSPVATSTNARKNSSTNVADDGGRSGDGHVENIYTEVHWYNEIPVYENDPPAVCISYKDLAE